MLSGLLIILNILVCIALIAVVLMQRSEGGGFAGGSPTGLVTARGASDLLTRTTWVLFATFMALSLGLTLLGAHDRATSGLIEKLKLQQVNPAAAPQTPAPAPPAGQGDSSTPAPSAPFSPFGAAPRRRLPRRSQSAGPGPRPGRQGVATKRQTPRTRRRRRLQRPPPRRRSPRRRLAPAAATGPSGRHEAPRRKSDPNAPVSTGQP